MPEVHEEQSGIYNAQLASLCKAMYEKAATVEGNKQDREPPASPPVPELNKYLLDIKNSAEWK